MQEGRGKEKKVFPGTSACVVALLTDVGNSGGEARGWAKINLGDAQLHCDGQSNDGLTKI